MPEQIVQSTKGFNCIFVHSALDDLGLKPSEFRLYAHLSRRASSGMAFCGVDSMAQICLMNHKTVRAALKELLRLKLVKVVERPGRTKIYHMTAPEEWSTPTVMSGGDPYRNERATPTVMSGPPPPKTGGEGYPLKVIQLKDGLPAEVEAWNSIEGLPKVKAVSVGRLRKLNARRKDPFWAEHFRSAIEAIPKTPFLMGQNERQWRADFDWILQPDAVAKITEGKYARSMAPKPAVPIWKERLTVQEQINRHPCNPSSLAHNTNHVHSAEQREELAGLKRRLQELSTTAAPKMNTETESRAWQQR